MVYRILVTRMSGCHLLILLAFCQEMITVLPVVSLAIGDQNAPKPSGQDLKVICRVADDHMTVEKVCLTILLILLSVILLSLSRR